MENPDLVLQETGSRPTYSRLNYVPSGDTLRRDVISSFCIDVPVIQVERLELIDALFHLSTYKHPDNVNFPKG